tara:strand:+ start:409 stop:783 length:375 start_codon:yes stop_codon:yes gene_type:complete
MMNQKSINGMTPAPCSGMDDPNSGGLQLWRGGEQPGNYSSANFEVILMEWELLGVRTTIKFKSSNIRVDFNGDITDKFRSDEDCLSAFPSDKIFKIIDYTMIQGISKGRRNLRNELNTFLNPIA